MIVEVLARALRAFQSAAHAFGWRSRYSAGLLALVDGPAGAGLMVEDADFSEAADLPLAAAAGVASGFDSLDVFALSEDSDGAEGARFA